MDGAAPRLHQGDGSEFSKCESSARNEDKPVLYRSADHRTRVRFFPFILYPLSFILLYFPCQIRPIIHPCLNALESPRLWWICSIPQKKRLMARRKLG